jgi:acetate kinase
MTQRHILVANIGSTSFKFRLFEMPSERVLAHGGVERIGSSEAPWRVQIGNESPESGVGHFPDYGAALDLVQQKVQGRALDRFEDLSAFGFKPVAARGISGTQEMDETVLGAMEAFNTLFPAHNPPYVAAVRAFRKKFPNVPCIGTFETAFYDQVPEVNRHFPVPAAWETEFGIQRMGFHGASHRFVSSRIAELRGTKSLRIISCHLGGSSSICAVRDGHAINSSWGMTPQSGLPQNNRVGDFDVSAALYLIRDCGLGLEAVEKGLNQSAGLKGLADMPSGDIRDLREAADAGNKRAQLALDVFVASIRKYIGQFLVEMNGADVLVFTAGIGENNPDLREAICADLSFCGLKLDREANDKLFRAEGIISAPDSQIEVRLIPTNEEIIIAREAANLLEGRPR